MLWVMLMLMEKRADTYLTCDYNFPIGQYGWLLQYMRLKRKALQKDGVDGVFRSSNEKISQSSKIYVVDTLGELRSLYTLTPVAVVGGSFVPGLLGHNISEAAAAGCAVLTGYHVGHFSHMVLAMHRSNPFSVCQVSGKGELVEALSELFRDCAALEARRAAAKQSFLALSKGIVANVWNLMHLHIIPKASLVR